MNAIGITPEFVEQLRRVAQSADDAFNAQLERQHGACAGDMRYYRHADDARTGAARRAYLAASDAWRVAATALRRVK